MRYASSHTPLSGRLYRNRGCGYARLGIRMRVKARAVLSLFVIATLSLTVYILLFSYARNLYDDDVWLAEPLDPHEYFVGLEDDDDAWPAAGPADPREYFIGLENVPGPDKILGTIRAHILRPQLRQRVHVPDVDPSILVSVKTTTLYHQHRLSLLLFTWMQTLSPHQLHIVTDRKAVDVWIREAHISGINVIRAKCPSGHTRESLCCKSGLEYEQFYKAMGKSVQNKFRWFCHFDDDEYLNIASLSKKLRTYNSSADYYIGHWLTKHGPKPKHDGKFKNFPETRRKSYFYATGASYCISLGLMRKVEKYFRGNYFPQTCDRIGLTDDYTIGAIIGGVLGVSLTEVSTMLSQGEDFTHFNITQLQNMITISSKLHVGNRIKVPKSPFTQAEDPTGFLSYHCLLYPHVNWCHNPTLLHEI